MTVVHTVRLRSREQARATTRCPCGQPLQVVFKAAPGDGAFPITTVSKRCTACGRAYRFVVEGYHLNPSGEAPVLESGIAVNMAALQRSLQLPSASPSHGID